MSSAARPLSGTKVLDLSRWIAGPHAALIMGDMGADVVKVETPIGDPSRLSGPHINGESSYFMALNRSKRGMVLDLRRRSGLDLLARMITQADVLIENYRPGTLADMGFADERLEALNPRLVIVSVSGFGQDGPYAGRGCFDSIAQAMSGLQSLTGTPAGPPLRAGFYVADYSAALHATIGALLALASRERTGQGQRVDVALVEGLLSLSATLIPGYLGAGVVPVRQGNSNPHAAPAGLFQTSDGYVQLAASTNSLFRALARTMNREDLLNDERFLTNQCRLANANDLNAEIEAWTKSLTARELEDKLISAGVPAGKLTGIAEIVQDEQLRHREFFASIEHPVAGTVKFAGPAIRLSRTPASADTPSPMLGQHTEEILRDWLGVRADEIRNLRSHGAFGTEEPAASQ